MSVFKSYSYSSSSSFSTSNETTEIRGRGRRTRTIITLLCLLFAASIPAQATPDIAGRIVRIEVTSQLPNPFAPWQFQPPTMRVGYGILLDSKRVLTTERLVRNQTQVELLRARTGEKTPAKVTTADPRMDLAILTLPNRFNREDVEPLALAGALHVHDPVQLVQFDDADDIQSTDATVSQIRVATLPETPYSALVYDVLTDLNVGGEGASIICSNMFAGLVINYQAATRIGTVLGYPFLTRFLEDADGAAYLGPASAGFSWKPLVDPAKRQFLGLGTQTGGIQIIGPMRGTGADGVLKPLDVIFSWNGQALDEQGFYDDPEFGRLEFSHLIKGKGSPGEDVALKIWRDGAPLDVSLTLGGDPDLTALVPENVAGKRAPYLVAGGLVLRELDMKFMQAFGTDWRVKTDPKFIYLAQRGLTSDQNPGDRVVILNGVLADPINAGYQQYRNRVVLTVNGKPVRNMAEVFAARDRDGLVHRVRLDSMGVDLVLDKTALPEANARIASQYRIPALEYRGDAGELPSLTVPPIAP